VVAYVTIKTGERSSIGQQIGLKVCKRDREKAVERQIYDSVLEGDLNRGKRGPEML